MKLVTQRELERNIARELAMGSTYNQITSKYKVSIRRINNVLHRYRLKEYRRGLVKVSRMKKDADAFKVTIPTKIVRAFGITDGDSLLWEVKKENGRVYAIVRKVDEQLVEEYLSKF